MSFPAGGKETGGDRRFWESSVTEVRLKWGRVPYRGKRGEQQVRTEGWGQISVVRGFVSILDEEGSRSTFLPVFLCKGGMNDRSYRVPSYPLDP